MASQRIDPLAATGTVAGGVPPTAKTVPDPGRAAPRGAAGADAAGDPPAEDDRYELGAELARGSMGRVLRAVDRRLDRDVAVKEMIDDSVELAARFAREARVIGRLQHPGIVPIYDLGRSASGRPFYSMRLVEGSTLHDAIKTTPEAERLALLPRVLAAVDAVAYAHSQRIIHRDLKPLNVLVGAFGETLVIDWGLAKDLASPGDEPVHADTPRGEAAGTRVGQVVGTPAYMPPEQAAGGAVDERADVYALGAMLYHVLAGAPPYADSDPDRILAEVVERAPTALSERRAGLPDDLLAIIGKAMARRPADRYRTARELAVDLRAFQTGQLVGAHHYTLRQRISRVVRRHRAAVVAAIMLVAAGVFILYQSFYSLAGERDAARRAQEQARQQRDAAEGLVKFMVSDLRDRLEPIGKLSLMDAVGQKLDAYYKAIPDEQRSGESVLALRANVLQLRGDVARNGGDTRAALALYQEAAALGQAHGLRDVTGRASLRVGDALLEQGDADGAERSFRSAFELGASPEITARARLRLGMVAAARGDHAAALSAWREAATALEDIARAHPDDRTWLYDAATAHGMLGDLLLQTNEAAASREAILRSRAIMEDLVAAEPDNPRWLRGVSLTSDRLGQMEQWADHLDAADAAFRSSLAVAEKLAEHDPDNAEWQSDLTISLRNVAGVAHARGRSSEAIDTLTRAMAIQDRLVVRDPDNVDRRQAQISIHNQLAQALESAGRHGDAVVSARRAVELGRVQVDGAPEEAWRRFYLGESLARLGELLLTAQPPAALVSLREARELLAPLVAGDDTVGEWRRVLAKTELGIARVLDRQTGNRAEAREDAARALAMLERLRDAGELENSDLGLIDQARQLGR